MTAGATTWETAGRLIFSGWGIGEIERGGNKKHLYYNTLCLLCCRGGGVYEFCSGEVDEINDFSGCNVEGSFLPLWAGCLTENISYEL